MTRYLIPMMFVLVLGGCERSADSGSPQNEVADTPIRALSQGDEAAAEHQLTAHVFQFGLYKATRKGLVKASADTNTGKVLRKPTLEHLRTTNRVPLKKDTYFGYQFRLFGLPPEAAVKPVMRLRKVLIHPQMTLPDGSTTRGWDRPYKARVQSGQVMGFDGYAFNEDYELVEGDWIFQIWYRDRKLIERRFVSYRPDNE